MRIGEAAPSTPSFFQHNARVPGVDEAGTQGRQDPGLKSGGSGGLAGVFDDLSRVLDRAPDQVQAGDAPDAESPAGPLAGAFASIGATTDQVHDLLNKVEQFGDHRLFFQRNNNDGYLNGANDVDVPSPSLSQFLNVTNRVIQSGGNINDFRATTQNVLDKGKYDDLDRFLDVTATMVDCGQDLDVYEKYANRMLNDHPADFETAIFDAQTFVSNGGNIKDFVDIADNLGLDGFEGRNNSVDFHRVLTDVRNHGGSVPIFFRQMAEKARRGDSIREYLNDYMDTYGLPNTRPNPADYDHLQRPDNGPLEITEGEHSALFAQAISSRDGLLPPWVLYWSSEEAGALGQGNLLDLSRLAPGTYHIVAKIGGLDGTDTAKQTVIVKARDADAPAPSAPAAPTQDPEAGPPQPRRVVMTAEDAGAIFAHGRTSGFSAWGFSFTSTSRYSSAESVDPDASSYMPARPFGAGYFTAAQFECSEQYTFAVFDDGSKYIEAYFWRRQLNLSLMMAQEALHTWEKAYEDQLEQEAEQNRRANEKGHRWADQLLAWMEAPPVGAAAAGPSAPPAVAAPEAS